MKRRRFRRSPSTDQLLDNFVSDLQKRGFSRAEAEEFRGVIADFQRHAQLPDLTMATSADIQLYLDDGALEQQDVELTRELQKPNLAEIDRDDLKWLRREVRRARKLLHEQARNRGNRVPFRPLMDGRSF
ncbi:MAG TPA: hypothetical protein VGQ75_10470 [Thermoanaerobaculia bacterium]|jgi:hypothetical protein|nr:hypothetical protein [Thermoanaerobaculia bacterium]HEV8608879.1 hypothetical protein [Thermoanaerobaculia bacterium]